MIRSICILMSILCLASRPACAFESDVHYGLTQWLAVEAGYSSAEAAAIALGNQRVDSGIMDTIELVLEYACLGQHADAAQVVRTYHFPSSGTVPGVPAMPSVAAGDLSARCEVDKIFKVAPGKADILLLKFGEALHLLQDSWAYQGVPDTPVFPSTPVQCDASFAWTAPAARGGWASHRADLTHQWSTDTTAMAAATYAALTQYPPIAGKSRTAAAWSTLLPQLQGFTVAATKAEKLRFVTGMRRKAWQRNCVAIGLSGGFLEPLESTSIHLVQTAIMRLLAFFPTAQPSQVDIDEYNRLSRAEFEHVRDFIILHYHATRRTDAPLWEYCRTMPIPASLMHKIDLYQAHGRITDEGNPIFSESNWVQVMWGQGLRPRGYHPVVDVIDLDDLTTYFNSVRQAIAATVYAMPTHQAFLASCHGPDRGSV